MDGKDSIKWKRNNFEWKRNESLRDPLSFDQEVWCDEDVCSRRDGFLAMDHVLVEVTRIHVWDIFRAAPHEVVVGWNVFRHCDDHVVEKRKGCGLYLHFVMG